MWTPSGVSSSGPSPHARGAADLRLRVPDPAGTIPARAGSSSDGGASGSCCRDHPRTRGEQTADLVLPVDRWGPSPHARGAAGRPMRRTRCRGTIPARAGSSVRVGPPSVRSRDHPRTRGEQAARARRAIDRRGPSPHARGAVKEVDENGLRLGTIPARAGSSLNSPERRHPQGDHPRTRGEQQCHRVGSPAEWGPSPHAPGAAADQLRAAAVWGTIPARAGSSRRRGERQPRQRDHPRTRREQVVSGLLRRLIGGTIPARAGSRPRRPRPADPDGDHPRTRREQSAVGEQASELLGTIPARAGSRLLDLQLYSGLVHFSSTFTECDISVMKLTPPPCG